MGSNKDNQQPQPAVDQGLIKMFLEMTPEERLRANDNTIRALTKLRNAFKKQKVYVLSLETIVDLKRESRDSRDLYRLPILEETLHQLSKEDSDKS